MSENEFGTKSSPDIGYFCPELYIGIFYIEKLIKHCFLLPRVKYLKQAFTHYFNLMSQKIKFNFAELSKNFVIILE